MQTILEIKPHQRDPINKQTDKQELTKPLGDLSVEHRVTSPLNFKCPEDQIYSNIYKTSSDKVVTILNRVSFSMLLYVKNCFNYKL